jgi:hypothetical protein
MEEHSVEGVVVLFSNPSRDFSNEGENMGEELTDSECYRTEHGGAIAEVMRASGRLISAPLPTHA